MKLSPNVGSDRSWVWNTAMDVSENPAGEPQTLAIRFANSESRFFPLSPPPLPPRHQYHDITKTLYNLPDANLFKEAFIKGQQEHEGEPQARESAIDDL